ERWSLVRAFPIRDGAGAVCFAVNVFRDVSESARAERHLRFLAEASALLASSLDYESTLERVAELAVPALADWCVVDIARPDGSVSRVAVVCADPLKEPLAERLRRHYPARPELAEGTSKVLRTGRGELTERVTDEW